MSIVSASPAPTTGADPQHTHDIRKPKVCIAGQPDPATRKVARVLQSDRAGYEITSLDPASGRIGNLLTELPDALLIHDAALQRAGDFSLLSIREQYPQLRILVYGERMDDDYLYELMRSGVHGYIHADMNDATVQQALETVINGDTWMGQHLVSLEAGGTELQRDMRALAGERIAQMQKRLTKRETEILAQVVRGLAIKQIAEEVHLSHQGVKMHLAKLFRKFNVSNRNQLILAALDTVSPLDNLSALLTEALNANHASDDA